MRATFSSWSLVGNNFSSPIIFLAIDSSNTQDYPLSFYDRSPQGANRLRKDAWKAEAKSDSGNSEEEGTQSIELWDKVHPQLEKALEHYDRLDSDSLPDDTRILQPKA